MENPIITFSSQFWKQDKRCMEDRVRVSPSISMWQSQSFMQRTAVVCCWQGTVWKVIVHIVCVSMCTHLSYLYMTLCPLWMSLWWLVITWLDETKERDPNRHSALRTSPLPDCVVFMCLNQRWLPSGLRLQWSRLCWINHMHARARPERSSFVCNVHQSVTECVYVYGSSRPSWPQCPPQPPSFLPLALQRAVLRECFTSLPSGLITVLQVQHNKAAML